MKAAVLTVLAWTLIMASLAQAPARVPPEGRTAGLAELVRVLALLRKPDLPPEKFRRSLERLEHLPVLERPEFWIKLATDAALPEDRRRQALYQFFGRHLKPGSPLAKLQKLGTEGSLFDPDTVTEAAVFAFNPIKASVHEDLYRFTFPMLRPAKGSIYLRISARMTPDFFDLVLKGDFDAPGVKVREVAVFEGDKRIRF